MFGGPALSVQTVSKLAGVDISHYAEINFDGFRDIVDALGGIEVDVPMTIDDEMPAVTWMPDRKRLTATRPLSCAARAAPTTRSARATSIAPPTSAWSCRPSPRAAVGRRGVHASTVQALSKYVTTDLGVTDIIGLAQAMQGLDPSTDIYSAMEPTTSEYIDGVWYEVNNTAEWKAMMKRVDAGPAAH